MTAAQRGTLLIAISTLVASLSITPAVFAADAMHGDAMHKTMKKHKGGAMHKQDAMHKDSMQKDAEPAQ